MLVVELALNNSSPLELGQIQMARDGGASLLCLSIFQLPLLFISRPSTHQTPTSTPSKESQKGIYPSIHYLLPLQHLQMASSSSYLSFPKLTCLWNNTTQNKKFTLYTTLHLSETTTKRLNEYTVNLGMNPQPNFNPQYAPRCSISVTSLPSYSKARKTPMWKLHKFASIALLKTTKKSSHQ